MNAEDYRIIKQSRNLSSQQKKELEKKVAEYSILSLCQQLKIPYTTGNHSSSRRGAIYNLVDHDSCVIWANANLFKRYSGKGKVTKGSAVAFLMAFGYEYTGNKLFNSYDYSLVYLNEHFSSDKKLDLSKLPKREKIEFILPKKAEDNKKAYAYLVKERGIDKDIINQWIKENRLFEGINEIRTKDGRVFQSHNCVFVSFDENNKPNFAMQRGIYKTKDGKSFKQDVDGSDYDTGFNVKSKEDKNNNLIVCEAVIDMLSLMSLYKDSDYYQNANYHSLNGVDKIDGLINTLKKNQNITDVLLCLDNDAAGRNAAARIKEEIKTKINRHILVTAHFPPTLNNDWNNELKMGLNPKWKSQLIDYMQSKDMTADEWKKLDEKNKEEIKENWMYPSRVTSLSIKR